MSCGCQEVRGESRDSPLGESQDSPHNATHMLFHYRIFLRFLGPPTRPPAQTLYAHFSDTTDDNHGEVYHRATAHESTDASEGASISVGFVFVYV